jgi:uncharacterized membrane protein
MGKQASKVQVHREVTRGSTVQTATSHVSIAQVDSPLPDGEELAKLRDVDPKLIEWLMQNASKEQDFRHNSHNEQLAEAARDGKSNRWLNACGMVCAFVLFMSGMTLGAYMLHLGHENKGMAFAGTTLLAAAALFLNRKAPAKKTAS